MSPKDQLSEIILLLQICEREGQLIAREIERAGLAREIQNPATSPERVQEATLRRACSLAEHAEIVCELEGLHEVSRWFVPRGALN